MHSISHLEPRPVFQYFEEISKIPRCSGCEKAISDHLLAFARKHHLEAIQDHANNIIIRKPAAPGYEKAPTVILQGHMDMVCEKNKDTIHDFQKDPIRFRIDGDMLYATDTTLGADNGIAVAYAMAILASDDIPHPPLEVLFTTEEETGMKGAANLDPKLLTGKFLINMDSEEEGKLLVSCAGGLRARCKLPAIREKLRSGMAGYRLSIRNLKGGHSGMDIDKGRGNANKLMGRILYDLFQCFGILLNELGGGAKTNAIPREADAILLIDPQYREDLLKKVREWDGILKRELQSSDPNVTVALEELGKPLVESFSRETTKKAIQLLMLIPNGIQSMSMSIPGLVESSINLGIVATTGDSLIYECSIRSSVRSLKYSIRAAVEAAAEAVGAQCTADSEYPEWEYDPESKLRELFQRVHLEKYGVPAEITAIHAGLECGLLKEKKPDLDVISFGPNLYDVHTPYEHLSIASVRRTWDYLLAVLAEIR